MNPLLQRLRHHVTGAIERGEGKAIVGIDPNRLEYLRTELRAERLSYGELAELQALVPYIDPSDTELLEAAGVPEFKED